MSSEAAARSILLVEDDPLLAATLRRHIERIAGSGSVSTAASVGEGAQVWSRLQADLALVDYRLPDGFGTDLIRKMRAAGSRTRVICMTAESEAITPEQRAQLEIEETLTKPVSPDVLGQIMQDNRVEKLAQPQRQPRRIGRFRLIRGRKAISGARLGRLMQAAENEKWIAFEIVPDHIQDNDLMRGLCAWAGWLSSRGGQLCILAGSPENARLAEQAANGLVDTVVTREQLKNKPSHLTSISERAQLISILQTTHQETAFMNTQECINSPRTGSATAAALLMSAIGMIAAMSLTTAFAFRVAQAAHLPPLQRHLTQAGKQERLKNEERALYHYRQAMGHTTNQAERAQIALDIAAMLVKDGAWRSARERHLMAADYIIALADAELSQTDQIRLSAYALKILPVYRETTFVETAHGLISRLGEPEGLPYRFNALAFETYFALHNADAACRTLAALESSALESQTEQMLVRQYRTRAIWRSIRQDAWHLAFARHQPSFPSTASKTEQQAHLMDLLVADVEALRQSGMPAHKFEALVMSALLAAGRHDMQTAITTLKEAAFNTKAHGRGHAAARLLELLKQTASLEDIDAARAGMLKEKSMQPAALDNIKIEMASTADKDRFRFMFETVAENLGMIDWSQPAALDLFAVAADIAIDQGELDIAEIAIQTISSRVENPDDPRLCIQKARLAAIKGNHEDAVQHLFALLSGNPSPELETQARFMLVEMVAKPPVNITHLVGTAIENANKRPQDPRSQKGMLITAQQLEDLKLYELSLSYYQKLTLLGSIQGSQSDDAQTLTAKGMLGQARVLLAMDRDQEADSMLRRINSHKELVSVWPESAPLWSALAMRQGQSREAYRRWKQACGPSNDSLLPILFDILVPDPINIMTQPVFVSRPQPSQPPPQLIRAAADAAFKRLLEQGDHEKIDMLLTRMKESTQWHAVLPLNGYRVEALNFMQASQPTEKVLDWMQRHAIETVGTESKQETLLSTGDLREYLVETDSIAMQARTRFL